MPWWKLFSQTREAPPANTGGDGGAVAPPLSLEAELLAAAVRPVPDNWQRLKLAYPIPICPGLSYCGVGQGEQATGGYARSLPRMQCDRI